MYSCILFTRVMDKHDKCDLNLDPRSFECEMVSLKSELPSYSQLSCYIKAILFQTNKIIIAKAIECYI